MIVGIGVDICEVHRFERLKANEDFLKRVFTQGEIEYCLKRARSAECLAARFAAKEAFCKAIGTGFGGGISLTEIEILKDSKGKPYFKISGDTLTALEQHRPDELHLSISHEKSNAIAFVTITRKV